MKKMLSILLIFSAASSVAMDQEESSWFVELKDAFQSIATFSMRNEDAALEVTFEGTFDLKDMLIREKNGEDKEVIMAWIKRKKQSGSCKITNLIFNTQLQDPNYFEITHHSLS
jgi:hypothetical protein